jgi:hypothetical protein
MKPVIFQILALVAMILLGLHHEQSGVELMLAVVLLIGGLSK